MFSPDVDLSNAILYYELDEFYANHRAFVNSRSYKQLRGESIDINDSKHCTGATKIKDLLPVDTYKRFTDNLATDFNPNDDLNPCG